MIGDRLGFRFVVVAAVWLGLAVTPCSASVRHPALASKAWLHAVKLQQNLEAKPSTKRTVAEYRRVIREYRNVYYYDFAFVKAPVAVQAMADLYKEMGRRFHDSSYFELAVKYYRYTMTEYPSTTMARESALAVGKVYLDDLHDPGKAAEAYQAFLEKHPRSSLSSEAQKKLKEIADMQAATKQRDSAAAPPASSTQTVSEPGPAEQGGVVEVTEVHKWVGPSYTRVVIGAQGPFSYHTIRLSHPDRIVFDLPNTRAQRDLLQKSVPINGAFLHDIRVGQFKPDVTRVVLDVRNISDFSAFSVPNPFRLIIDVHGTPSEATSKAPEQKVPTSSVAAATGQGGQEVSEGKTSSVRQASFTWSKTPAANSKHIDRLPQPKPGPAIEFQDQQAVKEKAEQGTKHDAGAVAKGTVKAEAEHPVSPAVKTKAAPAIEFQDQHAVKQKVENEEKRSAVPAANPKSQPSPEKHAIPQGKPRTESAASGPDVQKTQETGSKIASVDRTRQETKPQAVAASDRNAKKTASSKAEEEAVHRVLHAADRKVELGHAQTEHDALPFSAKPASPTEDGSQTLTRALGLKVARIVIDPGHGGFDTGTIGRSGLEEKDLVLDIGLRLRKLLETQTNSEVFMTRSTDKFIPLEERTAIANEDGADLFVSIHANASRDRRVRGIETYFLNFTSDPEALRLAARENATSQESVHQLQNLIQKIALNNKIEESQELARDIQTALYKHMSRVSRGVHNRGVRKAPFVVLIGANMPSILAEISFLSNPHSERLLKSGSYREQIAKALFNGIENYITNLGSVRVAQRTR